MDRAALDSVSVVVPVFNEEDNVHPLLEGILAAMRSTGLRFEAIFVDDGSSDATAERLRERVVRTPELVLIRLGRNCGQSVALQAGFDRARGDAIVTLDGDLQNDPEDIPRLLERIGEGADVVSGWRVKRREPLWLRRIPSWVANRLIRLLTRVPIHDQGCSLKAYRRSVIERLSLYSDMHRFIAVLAMAAGATIEEIAVRHHPRVAGQSKYGIARVFKVVADLAIIEMLVRFQERPTRWFAVLGAPFLFAALASGLAVRSELVVLPAVALACGLTFLWCLCAGLLGELILRTSDTRPARRVLYREVPSER